MAASLCSCSLLRSDYERTQAVVMDAQWEKNAAFVSSMRNPEGAWWLDFGDPVLTSLIERGLTKSNTIYEALLTLKKYELSSSLADLNKIPTPNASLSTGKSWNHNGSKSSSASASFGISYELDLFGKLAAERDVADMAYMAGKEDFLAVKLALSRQIAEKYWQIAYANMSLETDKKNCADYDTILKKAQLRFDLGDISAYDLNRTKENRVSAQNSVINDENSKLKAKHELMLLLSEDKEENIPGNMDSYTLEGKKVPQIEPGIPADILENRPDLKSAEYQVKSKLASYDVRRLAFLPGLTLTGSARTGSSSLFQFFDDPVLSLAGSLTAPFFNYSTLSINRDSSKADYEKSVYEFEDKIRAALFEVAEILKRSERGEEQIKLMRQRLEIAKQDDRNYDLRYDAGSISYHDYLENKQRIRTYQLAYYKQLQTNLSDAALLYEALGGTQNKQGKEHSAEKIADK